MTVRRVNVAWSGPGFNGPGLSSFWFNSAVGTAAQMVSAVQTFLLATDDERASGCGWITESDVPNYALNGTLIDIASVTSVSGTGSLAGDTLSPVTQGLLRLSTALIVNNRVLKGHIFLPAPTESVNAPGGIPSGGYVTDYNTAASAMISDANTEWVVFSRKHATMSPVTVASTWGKWAFLSSRRD